MGSIDARRRNERRMTGMQAMAARLQGGLQPKDLLPGLVAGSVAGLLCIMGQTSLWGAEAPELASAFHRAMATHLSDRLASTAFIVQALMA